MIITNSNEREDEDELVFSLIGLEFGKDTESNGLNLNLNSHAIFQLVLIMIHLPRRKNWEGKSTQDKITDWIEVKLKLKLNLDLYKVVSIVTPSSIYLSLEHTQDTLNERYKHVGKGRIQSICKRKKRFLSAFGWYLDLNLLTKFIAIDMMKMSTNFDFKSWIKYSTLKHFNDD